jgi:hypothetical protein
MSDRIALDRDDTAGPPPCAPDTQPIRRLETPFVQTLRLAPVVLRWRSDGRRRPAAGDLCVKLRRAVVAIVT